MIIAYESVAAADDGPAAGDDGAMRGAMSLGGAREASGTIGLSL